MTYDLGFLKNHIDGKFNKIQYFEIIKIVKSQDDKFSENANGVFINLSNLKQETLDKISDFVKFNIENENFLKEGETNINVNKQYINEDRSVENSQISLNSVQSAIFEEYKGDEREYVKYDAKKDEMNTVNLAKQKRKYNGNKAKILKNIKDVNKNSD